MFTVEDCIEILAGLQNHNGTFKLERSDYSLINSLARQTIGGSGYTDRQHELAKTKAIYYKEQFQSNGYDLDTALAITRLPLRHIDRSRWIRIDNTKDHPRIAVRFVFQKKLISQIEHLKKTIRDDEYDTKEKIHYFPLNERNVFEVISTFKNIKDFEIQEELKEYYLKLEDMNNNKENYIPGIYNLKLKNLRDKSLDFVVSSIGEPEIENLFHFYDRRDQLGLFHFDDKDLQESMRLLTPLSKKIIQRQRKQVLVNNKEYTVEHLAEVVLELYRFPLVIILHEEKCYDELIKFHNAFNGIIPNTSCSVMFRLDNTTEGKEFNEYVKYNSLNNLVDKNTKIVYINNKIPKPLLNSDWNPATAITTHTGRNNGGNKVDTYLASLELVIHFDDDVSPWKRHDIEKI